MAQLSFGVTAYSIKGSRGGEPLVGVWRGSGGTIRVRGRNLSHTPTCGSRARVSAVQIAFTAICVTADKGSPSGSLLTFCPPQKVRAGRGLSGERRDLHYFAVEGNENPTRRTTLSSRTSSEPPPLIQGRLFHLIRLLRSHSPVCGARKNHRAFACSVFRPLHQRPDRFSRHRRR